MSDQSISQLPVATTVSPSDLSVVVQNGITKQALVSAIANAISPGKLITSVLFDQYSNLVFNYSDGTSSTAGPIPGFVTGYVNGSGHLIMTNSTGVTIDFGSVVGPAGATGPTGPTGPAGTSATIAAGTATTLAYGATPTVTNTGSSSAAVFNFGIPAGQPGLGLPTGGAIGQVLAKASATNYDTTWVTISGTGTVTSVSGSGGTTGLTLTGGPITTTGTLTLGGTLNVANGGTGASTLTGYLIGNGTSAFTASTTIPTTALSGTITNAQLANSSITVNGTSIALGASGTITATATNALTIGTGLSGTSYNGSTAVTIAIDNTVTTLTGSQTLTNKTISGANNTLTNIGNSSLTNNSVTIGTTAIALGATSLTLGGLTSVAVTQDPVSALQLATKQYVDNVAQGLNTKAPVLVATTANITLSGEQTIDGVTTSSSRVLVKNQSLSQNNGIYLSGSGAWTRTTDANTWNQLVSAYVLVEEGTINGDTGWVCTVDPGGTLGTTPVTWVQFSGAGTYTAGNGLTLTGTQFSLSAPVSIANGGTNSTATPTAGGVGYGTGTAHAYTAAGTSNQILVSNGSSAPTWANLSTVGVSTFSGGTTGLTPNTATAGAITLAGTLAVANGGTGVTTSSGANSVVLRDANSNMSANSVTEGFSNVAAAGTTTVLTAASVPNYVVTGSGGQTYQLPDATTLPSGTNFTFNNNQSSGTIVVKNNSGTTVATVQSGAFVEVILLTNSPAAGSWDTHTYAPSNASWSTNTLSWAGSYTNGTWNGNVIGLGYGGTNANLTAVAGAVPYSTSSALALTAAGTAGQVLLSNGASAPTWSGVSGGTF